MQCRLEKQFASRTKAIAYWMLIQKRKANCQVSKREHRFVKRTLFIYFTRSKERVTQKPMRKLWNTYINTEVQKKNLITKDKDIQSTKDNILF